MNNKLAEEFEERRNAARGQHKDIHEHLPTLSSLAMLCTTVVEFGVRTGNSTIAFMHGMERGLGGTIFSFDLDSPEFEPPPLEKTRWAFAKANTAELADIPACDLLFIDTLHTRTQVEAELRHADRAKKYIVFHDTVTWGEKGERDQPGISLAIYDFLLANPQWRVLAHMRNCNGLLVLGHTAAQ